MKSDIYTLESLESDFRAIPAEAEKVAGYNGLDDKSTRRLRLLSEEMICMLPQLLIYGKGQFWIENEGRNYELHLHVKPDDTNSFDREAVIGVSTNKKNAAAKGIISKICCMVETMLDENAKIAKENPYGFSMAYSPAYPGGMTWSLLSYRNALSEPESNERSEEWDELERSIIANLADDVIVGVLGRKVDIIVKKSF